MLSLPRTTLASTIVLVLGGCTTYAAPRPTFAYYVAPCSAPGAFVAEPIEAVDPSLRASSPPTETGPAQAASATAPRCMVAVSLAQLRYDQGYYAPNYYGYRGFGAPFHGSVGIGIHGGHGARHGGHGAGHSSVGHGGH